jgi:sugar phosphate isomerase/epimerase
VNDGPRPFRLGTSTFICQGWPTPDQVRVLEASPVISLELASPDMWHTPADQVREGLSAVCASELECWSIHSPFGAGYDLSSIDEDARQKALTGLKRAYDLATEAGCRVVVVHPSSGEPIEPEERSKRIGATEQRAGGAGATAPYLSGQHGR